MQSAHLLFLPNDHQWRLDMQQDTLITLQAYCERNPIDWASPVPREEIRRAEQILGVAFHADYAQFIELVGGAIINGIQHYGLRRCELAAPSSWSVIVRTEESREAFGEAIKEWCIISRDNEYPVGITSNGEVAGYYYDASAPTKRIIASSYEEFLLSSLDATKDPFDIWGK
jgi:hypothetical protein